MFNIPRKEIIVNDDSQVVLKGSTDGVTYSAYVAGTNLSPATAAHRFHLEGWLSIIPTTALQLLASATRVRKTTGAAAVLESAAFTVTTSGGAAAGDIVMLRCDSVDLTPTEFQNKGFEKRYQFSSAKTTVATIISHLVATINADKFAPVTAYAGFSNASPAQDDSAKIVLIAKRAGVTIDDPIADIANSSNSITFTRVANGTTVYHTQEDTSTTTAAAALGLNTYDYLKNINWAKNFHIDQNLNWMPLPGVTYNSYYFEVNGTMPDNSGNSPVPNEVHGNVKTAYSVFVKNGLTLDTALNEFLTDMNV